jgi:signal transduction histidine kinase
MFNGSRVGRFSTPTRIYIGLAFLIGAIVIPSGVFVINTAMGIQPGFILPFLERSSLSLMMIWTAWLWLSYKKSVFMDVIAGILTILFPVIIISLSWIFPNNNISYNGSPADIIWHFLVILCSLIFTIFLLRSQAPVGAYGVGMMLLILTGFTLSLVFISNEGDVSGAARLGMLSAFPLLPVLAYRQEHLASQTMPPSTFDEVMALSKVPPLPERIIDWMDAAGNSEPIRLQEDFARLLCQSANATACVFLRPSERPGILHLTSGYDLRNRAWIESKELSVESIPQTYDHVKNNTQAVIKKNGNQPSEIDKFSSWLRIDDINAMAILPVKDTSVIWGSAILFRISSVPSFSAEDLQIYSRTMAALTNVFRNAESWKKGKVDIARLTNEINNLNEKNQVLLNNLESTRMAAVQVWPEPDLNQILTLQQASQSEIDRIQSENKLLLMALAEEREGKPPLESNNQALAMEIELRETRKDLTRLQNLLEETQRKVLEMEKRPSLSVNSVEKLRKYFALTKQIRDPLAAINGYVDLLMSKNEEDIIDPNEKKSLKSMHSSLKKLHLIMEGIDALDISQSGVIDLEPESMEMFSAIDQAISSISPALSQKGISLRLQLPDTLPPMQTYHEALQKVIVYLLRNAGKATPPNGTVELSVETHDEPPEPYLILGVTDGGGGIAPDDLKKVFTATPQMGHSIPGLGETGSGLTAAKTLIEAHGGRIWIDSVQGVSTTISVLLPVEKREPQGLYE